MAMERGYATSGSEDSAVGWQRRFSARRQELERRLRYVAATRSDWLRGKLGGGFDPQLRVAGIRQGRFFFSPREVSGLCALWRQRLPGEAAATVGRAEKICQHHFDLLGYENVACGPEIDWHADQVHGSQAPRKPWYKLWRLIEPNLAHAGDCRIVWALNRHQHLVTLAKAYRLTGNRKFAAEVFVQWQHWHAHNAYPLGLNWASSKEVAWRAMAWLWTYYLLLNTPELPRGFRAEWLRALHVSARHIERYALLHGPPPARLLAEGAALFFIGILCPELERAGEWKQRGWQILLEEAERLGRRDEAGFEASSCLHVHTVDLLLHASLLAAANDVPVPPAFETTLEKMLEVLYLLGRAGAPPRLGADDGGRLFNAQRNRAEHLLDPLATGGVLFGRPDFKAVTGELPEETLWLLGEAGVHAFDQMAKKYPAPGSTALPAAGLYLSASAERAQQVVIDARPAAAAGDESGQAGALSVSINRGGRALIMDPGDVAQAGNDLEWEGGGWAGLRLQNTLLVDWAEPPEAQRSEGRRPEAKRFETTEKSEIKRSAAKSPPAEVKVETWVSGRTFDFFAGSRSAGGPAEHPLRHRRWVFSLHSDFWLVRDLAVGDGVHRVGVFWHFNPEVLRHGGGAGMFVEAGGTAGLRVLAVAGHGWSQDIRQGFWSPVYGRREPLNVLQFSTTAELPAGFVTLLAPVENTSHSEGRLQALDEDASASGLVRGYRYQIDGNEHSMFFGGGGEWSLGPWKSDAEFLYWGESHDGGRRLLICCNGRYVENEGRRVISCGRPVARCELDITGDQMDVYCSDPDAQVSKRALDGATPEIAPEVVPEVSPRRRLKKASGQ